MTADQLKAVINANGGPECVLALVFDNSIVIQYSDDDIFQIGNIKTVGGLDIYEHHGTIRSESTKKLDLKVTNIHPLECLQAIQFVETPQKRKDADFTELTCLHG